jgi:hypothetical protein
MQPVRIAAALLLALAVATGALAEDVRPVGRVVQFEGAVVLLRGGEPLPASLDAAVFPGDRVRTYAAGKALVVLDGGVRLQLGPASELEVTRFLQAAPQSRFDALLRLLDGLVRVLISDSGPGGALDVQTSAATTSARATDFVVETTPERSSVLAVEREVTVTSRSGQSVVLRPGEGTDVRDDPAVWRRVRAEGFPPVGTAVAGPPSAPTAAKTWGAARRERVLALTAL